MTDAIIMLTTVETDADATRIADALVADELAACVNVLPAIQSIYRWQGEIHHDTERLLVIKTLRSRFESVRDRLLELHPYDLPEVVALPIEAGSDAYLRWIGEQVND